MDKSKLMEELKVDEGVRRKAYVDTVGKITIGVGRNLTDIGLSDAELGLLLDNDITKVCFELDNTLPWWRQLDDARQNALANMCFNLGLRGLLGFPHFLLALKAGDWETAAAEMLNSRWAKQVGPRATRLAAVVKGA